MARARISGIEATSSDIADGSVSLDFGAGLASDAAGAGNGDVDANGEHFDPDRHAGRDKRNADGSWTRKRGRRAGTGSGSASGRAKAAPAVNTIEQSLIGIHALLAAMTKTPELALDSDESKPLAVAVSEVAKHYDIPGLDAKTVAWMGLIMVAGKIYVPRVMLVQQRLEREKQERKPSNVVKLVEPEQPKPVKQPKSKQPPQQEIDPLNPPLGYPV